MPALLASDHRDHIVSAFDGLRNTYERRRRTAERFALHAARINDKHTADYFSREARVWEEAIDHLAERIQLECGR